MCIHVSKHSLTQHRKRVIHRDLKADNVFFVSDTHIKIGDFGFSTHSSGKLLATFCGSPHYAAPELFAKEDYHGHLVDIWALGVTLYFMLACKLPFFGDSISKLRIKIQEGKYDTLTGVSKPCQRLIDGLLTVDPSSRWTLGDIESSVWMLGDQVIPQASVNQVSVTIQMPSEATALSGDAASKGALENATEEEWRVDTDILSQLEKLGVPVCDDNVFVGEPRNSLAGAYRILTHRKLIDSCSVDQEAEAADNVLSKQSSKTNLNTALPPTERQTSQLCTVL